MATITFDTHEYIKELRDVDFNEQQAEAITRLQTVEAIYDPKQGLIFSEPVAVENKVKVLVTFIESVSVKPSFKKGSAQNLLAALNAHPLPHSAQLSDADIDAQIQENAQGWE